jgi:hypothetical protein
MGCANILQEYQETFEGVGKVLPGEPRIGLVEVQVVCRDWMDAAQCIADAAVNYDVTRPDHVAIEEDVDAVVWFSFYDKESES